MSHTVQKLVGVLAARFFMNLAFVAQVESLSSYGDCENDLNVFETGTERYQRNRRSFINHIIPQLFKSLEKLFHMEEVS